MIIVLVTDVTGLFKLPGAEAAAQASTAAVAAAARANPGPALAGHSGAAPAGPNVTTQ